MNPYAEFDALEDDREIEADQREADIKLRYQFMIEDLAKPLHWKMRDPHYPTMAPRNHCEMFIDNHIPAADDELVKIIHMCALLEPTKDSAELGRLVMEWFKAQVQEAAEYEYDATNR